MVRDPQSLACDREQFTFLESSRGNVAAFTPLNQGSAEEFPISTVDQCMGRQNLVQVRERPCGSERQRETCELIALLPQSGMDRTNGFFGKVLCFRLHAEDELAGLVERHLPCTVVGLPKLVGERFDRFGRCRTRIRGPSCSSDTA